MASSMGGPLRLTQQGIEVCVLHLLSPAIVDKLPGGAASHFESSSLLHHQMRQISASRR